MPDIFAFYLRHGNYELTSPELFQRHYILDDCLWDAWQEGMCDCDTGTQTQSRLIFRNATGEGKQCIGDFQRMGPCICSMDKLNTLYF